MSHRIAHRSITITIALLAFAGAESMLGYHGLSAPATAAADARPLLTSSTHRVPLGTTRRASAARSKKATTAKKKGPHVASGPAGPPGPAGAPGAQGPKGAAGATGATGAT